jgi:hypothetical protein
MKGGRGGKGLRSESGFELSASGHVKRLSIYGRGECATIQVDEDIVNEASVG